MLLHMHLHIPGTQQLGQSHPISCRLIEHQGEFPVDKHEFSRFGVQALLYILRDTNQHRPALSEPIPALIDKFAAVLADAALAPSGATGEEQDLVDIGAGVSTHCRLRMTRLKMASSITSRPHISLSWKAFCRLSTT